MGKQLCELGKFGLKFLVAAFAPTTGERDHL
jgi:hypothetical protein